jgi:hypothetical protein
MHLALLLLLPWLCHTGAVRSNAVAKVSRVFDEYLAFVALEATMFSLGLPDCYLSLNDPLAKDAQIEVGVG